MVKRQATSIGQLAWQKFKSNKIGRVASLFIVLISIVSLFAYFIIPDKVSNANQMHLAIHSKSPGFKTKILQIPIANQQKKSILNRLFFGKNITFEEIAISDYTIDDNQLVVTLFKNKDVQTTLKKSYPLTIWKDNKPLITSKTFYLGTDKYGRDMLSRLIIGSRISLAIGLVAVFISLFVGLFFGALAGYYGGWVDKIIMWFINISWSIPTLLLVIAITLALGKGFWQVFIAVGLTMWVDIARIVRGQVLTIKEEQYIEAGKALGFSNYRILKNHILPNIMAPVIVMAAANFAAAILIESGLSFLGVGAQAPMPSWGGMIKDHYQYIILGKPYLALIPGIAIMLLVMAFMQIGNALRDSLDVKN